MSDIVELLGVALLANCLELPIIWWFSRPQRLMKRLEDPSKEDMASLMAFFSHLARWMFTPSIEKQISGAKKGEFHVVSPIEAFGSQIASSIVSQIRGVQGSVEKELNSLNLPMKNESSWAFMARQLAQQMLPQLIPVIQEAATAKAAEFLKVSPK
jgi:hypothetical protein